MRSFLVVLVTLISVHLSAQSNFSRSTRTFLREMDEFGHPQRISNEFADRYGLINNGGEFFAGLLLKVDQSFDPKSILEQGGVISSKIGSVISLRIPITSIKPLKDYPGIRYVEIGSDIGLDLERSRMATRVDSVHLGLGGLNMPYTGKGVIVAIIDWGFNYSHPVFYDSSGKKLRISMAWDQNKLSGPAPFGYTFGTLYSGDSALLAAEQDTAYNIGTRSHGTHVGGIAAGNGSGSKYTGMAKDAEIIMVSLRRDAGSFIDAISFIHNYAASVNKPYVVNMSFGGFTGANDGLTLESEAMNMLSKQGGIFVASAGNSGGVALHLGKNFPSPPDTLKTVVNFNSNIDGGYYGQALSMWSQPGSELRIKFRLVNASNNSIIFESGFHSSASDSFFSDFRKFNTKDSFYWTVDAVKENILNGKANIMLGMRNKTPYKVILYVVADGQFHMWSVARLWTRVSNIGVALASNYPGATPGNVDHSLGGYAGVTPSVITVAAYKPDFRDTAGNVNSGAIANFTSRGPTVDGRRKPEIAGPGEDIISSINKNDENGGTVVYSVMKDSVSYPFASYSGTSMSSPAVAGIVALMLQANPKLPAERAKQILIATARLDKHTGQISDTGNVVWGWGKANALAAILLTRATVGKEDIKLNEEQLFIYPNPANDQINVAIPGNGEATVTIYDLSGKNLREMKVLGGSKAIVNISGLASGVYLLETKTSDLISVGKFVKE